MQVVAGAMLAVNLFKCVYLLILFLDSDIVLPSELADDSFLGIL